MRRSTSSFPKAPAPSPRSWSPASPAIAPALDEILAAHTKNWRLARMATVDRNVLRLAVFELLYTTIPAPVVIDEAVELARRFGGEKSPAFVNGILDAVAHAVRPEGA